MARSLALYVARHAGESPRRVAVHKTTRFRDADIDGCFDALNCVDELELV